MKTRKYKVPSKPMVSDAGVGMSRDRPRERRTLALRYGDAQGSELAR